MPSMESSTTHSLDSESDTKTPDRSQKLQLLKINETGHVQEVERNFSLFAICSVGMVTGNTWAALGGSIVIAIYNGGPPGVLYEFITVSVFYWLIASSLAEMASSMPSSAGVYHWASITPGPRYGPIIGWFAGWWNTFAWMCGTATMASISGQTCIAMYGVYHPDYSSERWHVFIAYLIICWACCSIVLFANRALPIINIVATVFVLGGVILTIIVCVTIPYTAGTGHATSSFVWAEWSNKTGYTSDGFVFCAGMLNGAFSVGTPDCVSHLAEEIPNPKRNVPLAMAAQMLTGFITAFCYLIAIFYAITNMEAVLEAPYFPLPSIYAQATSSRVGTTALLFLILIPILCCCIGTFITSGRCLWTISRDGAVPFPQTFGKIHREHKNPFNATVLCGVFCTILGTIYVGSSTAFNALVGSFIVLTTLSYLAAILPFILTRRFSLHSSPPGPYSVRPGPFQMGHYVGYAVNSIACAYMLVFMVIYCFPYTKPFDAASMNYSSVIAGSVTACAALWWRVRGGRYVGPRALVDDEDEWQEDSMQY
ncbi:related to cholin permease [Rhynchosporium secalis]|uniref:Related to cholin permease n=1 Tax=Rhynchosporium secalis TaxID=38038 RepID=A0A1E1M8W1_RHYSE|nr:related to cholin permease [Rhynchosporium secalis]